MWMSAKYSRPVLRTQVFATPSQDCGCYVRGLGPGHFVSRSRLFDGSVFNTLFDQRLPAWVTSAVLHHENLPVLRSASPCFHLRVVGKRGNVRVLQLLEVGVVHADRFLMRNCCSFMVVPPNDSPHWAGSSVGDPVNRLCGFGSPRKLDDRVAG